jgi:hypothetical protein
MGQSLCGQAMAVADEMVLRCAIAIPHIRKTIQALPFETFLHHLDTYARSLRTLVWQTVGSFIFMNVSTT